MREIELCIGLRYYCTPTHDTGQYKKILLQENDFTLSNVTNPVLYRSQLKRQMQQLIPLQLQSIPKDAILLTPDVPDHQKKNVLGW